MPEIRVVPLGAGQEVGRSCILISIGGKNIMLDCGMHMGFNDDRRFPDFSYIGDKGPLDDYLTCVIISHFHLDHCGALPYMTEMVGYKGKIYMTHPTKAICPVLLEDYRKVQVDIKGDTNFFTSQMIKECMKKVVAVNLHEIVQIDDELQIKPYYAGHVLGAAMFEIRVGSESVVYTGDFNMTPDRHLGAAEIDACEPDLLISESTYATTIRDSKRARERDFLKKIHDCVDRGGKVLIPVFALGRAQELCILLESYWERMNLKVPIYFSQGLAERATDYYKLFISWTNEKIKRTFVQRNMFDFKHISPFDVNYAEQPGPMVLFATPGMLHGGQSLRVFEKWAPDEKNMVIMPGYCVQGTVGYKIINGARKIEMRGRQVEVKLAVEYMSFSAHADAKGIMQLIRNCQPRNVMFVHGENAKMEFLKEKVEKEFNVPVYKPANGETVSIKTSAQVVVDVSRALIKRCLEADPRPSKRRCPFRGALTLSTAVASAFDVVSNASATTPTLTVLAPEDVLEQIGAKAHSMRYTVSVPLKGSVLKLDEKVATSDIILQKLTTVLSRNDRFRIESTADGSLNINGGEISIKVMNVGDERSEHRSSRLPALSVSWELQDEAVGGAVLKMICGS